MMTRIRLAIACTALALPFAAAWPAFAGTQPPFVETAQASTINLPPFIGTDRSADLGYCLELARIYSHYNNWTLANANSLGLCGNGNAVNEIPTLQKALADQGFTVPQRR